MKRAVLIATLLALLGAGAVVSTPLAVQAATRSPAPSTQCLVMKVILHGSQAPQTICLRAQPTTGKAPAIWSESDCWGDLVVYQDAGYGAEHLCFTGVGSVNLTDYSLSCWFCRSTWNDQVSSFQTGRTFGHFSWDSNDGGAHDAFWSNEHVPWIGRAWNDQISGITIDGPAW